MFTPIVQYHDNYSWLKHQHLQFSKKIEIYANTVDTRHSNLLKVLITSAEPAPLRTHASIEKIITRHRNFALILTLDTEVLAVCPNAALFPFGTTWIEEHDRGGKDKVFGTSFICGEKRTLPGHILRQHVWQMQPSFKTPIVFWNSFRPMNPNSNPTLSSNTSDKIKPMRQEFHICIENCCIENYFSEKIMDCFVTKTIPIYYGCPNIGNFFNTQGMILVNSAEEIVEKVNSLTPDTYASMLEHVNDNFERAKPYCIPIEARIKQSISARLGI